MSTFNLISLQLSLLFLLLAGTTPVLANDYRPYALPCNRLEYLNEGGVIVLPQQEDIEMAEGEGASPEVIDQAERLYRYVLWQVDRDIDQFLNEITEVEVDPGFINDLTHAAQEAGVEFDSLYLNVDYPLIREIVEDDFYARIGETTDEYMLNGVEPLQSQEVLDILDELAYADHLEVDEIDLGSQGRFVEEWIYRCICTRIAREAGATNDYLAPLIARENRAFIEVLKAFPLSFERRLRLHVNNAPLRDAYALIQGALRDMHEAHDFANIPWVSEVMRLSGLDIIQFTLLRLGVNFEQLESQGVESLGALFVELGIPSNPALFVINQGDIDAHPDVYRSTLGLSLRRFLGLCGNPQLSSENAMISVVIDLVLSSLYELGGNSQSKCFYENRALQQLVEVFKRNKAQNVLPILSSRVPVRGQIYTQCSS